MLEAKSWKEGDISCGQSIEINDSEMMNGYQSAMGPGHLAQCLFHYKSQMS